MLVDTNVVLDVLLGREPHVERAGALWREIELGSIEGWVAAHTLPTIFYLVRKLLGPRAAADIVPDLLRVFRVAAIDGAVLHRAVALGLADFEDAVAAAAAEAARCDAIVTRDAAGFRGSPVEVLRPVEALERSGGSVAEPPVAYGVRRRRRSLAAGNRPAARR